MITYKTLINSSIININSQLYTLKYNCKNSIKCIKKKW